MNNGRLKHDYNQSIPTFNINYLTKEKFDILMKDYKYVSRIENQYEIRLKSFDNYPVKYQSIYEKELQKILNNLPNICLLNISSKKLLNCNNNINLIDLDNDEEFFNIEVD